MIDVRMLHTDKPIQIHGWSDRVYDILLTLTRRVRMLSIDQVAEIWWNLSKRGRRNARRCVRELVEAKLLTRHIINTEVLHPEKPIVVWAPGDNAPHTRQTAIAISERWSGTTRPTEVVCASRLTANLFGSAQRELSPRTHWDHDLLLGAAYASYRRDHAGHVWRWVGEDAFSKAGFRIKDPDAFLIDDEGKRYHVIESGGRYSTKQVRSFHEHCAQNQLSYEIW